MSNRPGNAATPSKDASEVMALHYIDSCQAAADEGDYEKAHVFEDDAYVGVLKLIASEMLTAEEAISWAKKVLVLNDLNFSRWYA